MDDGTDSTVTGPQIASLPAPQMGDDAFGVHVIQNLQRHRFPQCVRVVDFGIRGIDLVYALMDEPELAILIDAAPRGQPPGTLYVIEPQLDDGAPAQHVPMEAHSMDPAKVLAMVQSLGGKAGRVLVVGCEPTPMDPDTDMQMDLSGPVRAAIEPAARTVIELVARFLERPNSLEVSHDDDPIQPAHTPV